MLDWLAKYWLQVLFAGITGACSLFCKRIWDKFKKEHTEQKLLKDGVLALLRNGIIRNYNEYIKRGWIPIYALENVESMYAAYHALGGNGAVTKLVEELRELPSTPPTEKNT